MQKGRWCTSHDVGVQGEVTNIEDKGSRMRRCVSFHGPISNTNRQFRPLGRDHGFKSLQGGGEMNYDTSKDVARTYPWRRFEEIPQIGSKIEVGEKIVREGVQGHLHPRLFNICPPDSL